MHNSLSIIRIFLVSIFFMFLLSSCHKVILKIDKLPSNTPASANIYVTGNFNLWDPGDNRYQMAMMADSTYVIELPRTLGRVEYKFTRGNWSTVEQNKCGYQIDNRFITGRPNDTIRLQIESWSDLDPVDCDSVTIVLDKIPENLKPDDKIKIAGNFNAWNPGQKKEYEVKTNPETGKKYVTISRKANKKIESGQIEYLFVRDTVATPEVDRFGRELGSRVLQLERGDTVNVTIENWKDKVKPGMDQVTIIIDQVPANTPANDAIYLVGNFNNWYAGDDKYQFVKQADGTYKISIARQKYGLSFKITRGGWNTEFSDKCGNKFDNQDYNYDEIDTLHIAIQGWIDKVQKPRGKLVFIVDSLPAKTPVNAEIYMACDGNGWNAANKNYQFELRADGRYYLEKSRDYAIWSYKITRGSWFSQEATSTGLLSDNHWINKDCVDTVHVKVDCWNDIIAPGEPVTTIIITKWPDKHHDNPIFLVGAFNNWQPGDKQFVLSKDSKDRLTITVASRWLKGGFKFTQGGWDRVETQRNGDDIDNRVYSGNDKTLELEIEGWKR